MPLPPGMVPSDSRENMLQVLPEKQDHSLLQNNKVKIIIIELIKDNHADCMYDGIILSLLLQ